MLRTVVLQTLCGCTRTIVRDCDVIPEYLVIPLGLRYGAQFERKVPEVSPKYVPITERVFYFRHEEDGKYYYYE